MVDRISWSQTRQSTPYCGTKHTKRTPPVCFGKIGRRTVSVRILGLEKNQEFDTASSNVEIKRVFLFETDTEEGMENEVQVLSFRNGDF